MVAGMGALNSEFPWAIVDEANSFSRQAQAEDEILREKRGVKSSLSFGAYALAHISSYYLLFLRSMIKPPWVAPPMILINTLISTLLGGLVLGVATEGPRFLWMSFGIQGFFVLEVALISWYCDAFTFPHFTAGRSPRCGSSFWSNIGSGIFWLAVISWCILTAALTFSDDNPWVGRY